MKTSIVVRVVGAFFSSAMVSGYELQPDASLQASLPEATPLVPLIAPMLDPTPTEGHGKLDLRQATAINNAATQAPVQYPSITTNWAETIIGGATTYVPVVYTQTFAAVPDQWGAPVPGTIGYGTLSKTNKKRDVPEPTVYVIPVEMVLQTRNVIQPIQPVLPVVVVQPVTIMSIRLVEPSYTADTLQPIPTTSIAPLPTYSTTDTGNSTLQYQDSNTADSASRSQFATSITTSSTSQSQFSTSIAISMYNTDVAFIPTSYHTQQSNNGNGPVQLSFQPFWYNSSQSVLTTSPSGSLRVGSIGGSRTWSRVASTGHSNASAAIAGLWSFRSGTAITGTRNDTIGSFA